MKNRDIFLDFTSLLDVTLIIIFFFVLFSHLDNQENQARVDTIEQQAAVAIKQAEHKEASADKLLTQLEEELDSIQDQNERIGKASREMINFNNNDNLKLIMDMEDASWKLRVLYNNELISRISSTSSVEEELLKLMEDSNIDFNETIFCELVFDGSIPGTKSAYSTLMDALKVVRNEYDYFYVSETDLSLGEE